MRTLLLLGIIACSPLPTQTYIDGFSIVGRWEGDDTVYRFREPQYNGDTFCNVWRNEQTYICSYDTEQREGVWYVRFFTWWVWSIDGWFPLDWDETEAPFAILGDTLVINGDVYVRT